MCVNFIPVQCESTDVKLLGYASGLVGIESEFNGRPIRKCNGCGFQWYGHDNDEFDTSPEMSRLKLMNGER